MMLTRWIQIRASGARLWCSHIGVCVCVVCCTCVCMHAPHPSFPVWLPSAHRCGVLNPQWTRHVQGHACKAHGHTSETCTRTKHTRTHTIYTCTHKHIHTIYMHTCTHTHTPCSKPGGPPVLCAHLGCDHRVCCGGHVPALAELWGRGGAGALRGGWARGASVCFSILGWDARC